MIDANSNCNAIHEGLNEKRCCECDGSWLDQHSTLDCNWLLGTLHNAMFNLDSATVLDFDTLDSINWCLRFQHLMSSYVLMFIEYTTHIQDNNK